MSSRPKKYKDKAQNKHKFGGKQNRKGGAKQEVAQYEEEEKKEAIEEGSSEDSEEEVISNRMEMKAELIPLKLAMWYFDQCDPKKCSGMALKRHGMLETIPIK